MNLSTIQKKKEKLVGNLPYWVCLSGEERKAYQALCQAERTVLLKQPIDDRKVNDYDMDAR